MATYPIKMLKDEAGNPFLPLTSPSAVKDPNNTSWQDLIDEKIDEPATEGTSGQVLTTDGNGGRTWADAVSAIKDLSDVSLDTSTLTDGQTLIYDSANDEWVNGESQGEEVYSTTETRIGT